MDEYGLARKLTPSERKEIAEAFGWKDIDGVRDNILGMRPLYNREGHVCAWLDDEHVPRYDTDTLRFVRKIIKNG